MFALVAQGETPWQVKKHHKFRLCKPGLSVEWRQKEKKEEKEERDEREREKTRKTESTEKTRDDQCREEKR